jgi:hypothetical protein
MNQIYIMEAPMNNTPPFVQNADGIWHESPLDRFLMEVATAWMAGVSELGAEMLAPAARHLANRFPTLLGKTCTADFFLATK